MDLSNAIEKIPRSWIINNTIMNYCTIFIWKKTNLCDSVSGLFISSAIIRMWFNFNFIIFNWSQNYFLFLISKIKFWNWVGTRIK